MNNSLYLNINNIRKNTFIPSSFDNKKVVLWLAEDFSTNVTKVKLSNYSSTITLTSVRYSYKQKFEFLNEGGAISKLMYSTNFYDTDSEQYHRIITQEKISGSYIL